MRRLLIVACGATKRPDAGLLPAIERYDGPPYKTLRRALAEQPEGRRPAVLILSAKFGLIRSAEPIPSYDLRMTASRAAHLRSEVRGTLRTLLEETGGFAATMINLGADYLPGLALDGWACERLGALTYAHGGIGERMAQMRQWVASDTPVSA